MDQEPSTYFNVGKKNCTGTGRFGVVEWPVYALQHLLQCIKILTLSILVDFHKRNLIIFWSLFYRCVCVREREREFRTSNIKPRDRLTAYVRNAWFAPTLTPCANTWSASQNKEWNQFKTAVHTAETEVYSVDYYQAKRSLFLQTDFKIEINFIILF